MRAGVGRDAGEPRGYQADCDRPDVRGEVPRVGQQGERVGEQAADHGRDQQATLIASATPMRRRLPARRASSACA